MLPQLAVNNRIGSGLVYAHPFCDLGRWYTRIGKPTDFLDFLGSHFCRWMVLSSRASTVIVSAFLGFVEHVLMICAQPKVIGIHAWRVIAFVANQNFVRNGAIVQFVRNPVRTQATLASADDTVPCIICWPLPFPALIWLTWCYMFPKFLPWRAVSFAMTWAKGLRLPFQRAGLEVGFGCNGRIFSAPALTHAVGVFKTSGFNPGSYAILIFARIMPIDVAEWLAFNPAVFVLCLDCYLGFLPTTAVAIAVRDFVRDILGLHKNLQFLCQAWDVSSVARHFVLGCYFFILAHLVEKSNGRDLLKAVGGC